MAKESQKEKCDCFTHRLHMNLKLIIAFTYSHLKALFLYTMFLTAVTVLTTIRHILYSEISHVNKTSFTHESDCDQY